MDSDDNLLFYIALLIILILASAFFTLSEIAILTLNDSKLRKVAQDGNEKARKLVAMIDQPGRFLATIQLGITFSGFLAAALAADVFADRLMLALGQTALAPTAAHIVSLVVITLLLVTVTIIFGELLPKRIGAHFCEKIAFAVASPLWIIATLEKPMVFLLSSATRGILRLLGINPDLQPGPVTEEEIRLMIDAGNESGNIQEGEKDMINNIFEFDDRDAAELMTHRTEVVAVEIDTPLEDVVATALESGYSRILVYEDSIDSIKGILYVKDLLVRVLRSPEEAFDLKVYMREPFYVLESTKGEALLKEFQEKKMHMAIVIDEYGGTSGIITMEDLLESIVGNIQDEYDNEEEEIAQISENLYLIDGLADLEEVAKFFQMPLTEEDEDDYETIGGYIMGRLGSIPGEGEHPSVEVGDVRFTVSQMEERRIFKLTAEIVPIPIPQEVEEA